MHQVEKRKDSYSAVDCAWLPHVLNGTLSNFSGVLNEFSSLITAVSSSESPKNERREATNVRPSRQSIGYFDWVRIHGNTTVLSPEVTKVTVSKNSHDGGDGGIVNYRLRHFVSFSPFTFPEWNQVFNWDKEMTGVFLALQHLDHGIYDVAPQIQQIHSEESPCKDTKFTIEFVDTYSSIYKASRTLTNDILPRRKGKNPKEPFPTALIGSLQSRISSPLAILSGVNSLVQVSPASTSSILDNKDEYPLFGRTVASVEANAKAAVSYLSSELGVTHVGVLYVRDEWGTEYFQAFEEAAGLLEPPMVVMESSYHPAQRDILSSLDILVESEFQYFFGIMYKFEIVKIMPEAHKRGIAGEENFWLFPESALVLNGNDINSLPPYFYDGFRGAGVISTAPRSAIDYENDKFKAFISHWNKVVEEKDDLFENIFLKRPVDSGNAIWELGPTPYSMLMYDTVVALALATCDAESRRGDMFVDAKDIYESLMEMEFDGASGYVKFDKSTGSRHPATFPFAIYNVVADKSQTNDSNSSGTMRIQLTHTTKVTLDDEQGKMIEWEQGVNFIYNDGTNVPPPPLRPLNEDLNLISDDVIVVCIIFCALTVFLSLGFGIWTVVHKETPVVKKAQPMFLGMLCLGTFIMGWTIVFMCLQEPVDKVILDVSCMATAWTYSLGFVVAFSALFSKTYRLNKLFINNNNFRRFTVTEKDVLGPFVALLLFSIVILVSWTVVAPLRYTRTYDDHSTDHFGRPMDSYAFCLPDEGRETAAIIFAVLLIGVYIVALLFALYEAYEARSISTEYSESRFIAVSMGIIFEAMAVGIPVLVVSRKDPTYFLFVSSILVTIVCVAVLLPIFVPKIHFLQEWRKERAQAEQRRVNRLKRLQEFEARIKESCRVSISRLRGSFPKMP